MTFQSDDTASVPITGITLPPESVRVLALLVHAINETGAKYAMRGDHDGNLIADAMYDLACGLQFMVEQQ